MNILLTGGTGFVGIALLERLLKAGINVTVFDRNSLSVRVSHSLAGYPGKLTYINGNVLDREQLSRVMTSQEIDRVIHAAAITPDLEREATSGKSIVDVNCGGLVNVLEAANETQVEQFIYLSTGAVYGKGQWLCTELFEKTTPADPETYYEITKFAGERICQRYRELTGLNTFIFRLGDVFGAWEYYSGSRDVLSAPFQVTRMALLGQKALLPRPGLKNWVYSRDIASCILDGLNFQNLNHRIYHVSAPYRWSIENWCDLLSEKYPDFSFEITNDESLSNVVFRPDHAPMNIQRLNSDIKTELNFDLRKSFDDYTTWAESNRDFFKLQAGV